MNVLVTGGTGFIGSHLVERLCARGHQVVCVAKDPMNVRNLNMPGCRVILADLNDGVSWESLLDGVETLYHVAGVTRARVPQDYYDGNTEATRRLVQSCTRFGRRLQRFLYVGSLAAAGPCANGCPLTEEDPCRPVSHYGRSKLLGELEVLRVRDRIPVTVVRPSAAYGPRDRDWLKYMRMVKQGYHLLIGMRDKILNLIHSDDLVDGIMRAAESPAGIGRVYFLGSEKPCTVREIGRAMAQATHSRPVCVRLPHAVVYAVGAVAAVTGRMTGRQVLFNTEKARESVQPVWACSVERARSDLGFCQKVTLEEGMRQTYAWYRQHGWI